MRVAFIHTDKKIGTGAHHINELMAVKLRARGIRVQNFYPRSSLLEAPAHLKGLANILFFYSLLEHKKEVLKHTLVQGTTYSPLPFLAFDIPVVSHFGSTTRGFLEATPMAVNLEPELKKAWYALKKEGVISEVNVKSRRPMRDIAEVEHYVAVRAKAIIATSQKVKEELLESGIDEEKIVVMHNAIEDYWFMKEAPRVVADPQVVFLGRIGSDAFTLKLKGFDRLINLFARFPDTPKSMIYMSTNKKIDLWLTTKFSRYQGFANIKKDLIPGILRPLCGSILFLPSRYEGFSLSLIEGMSQGLVPVAYPVGVVPEILRDGENGFIVHSQREATARVKELLENHPLRERLSRAAYETALGFTGDILAQKLDTFYRSITTR